MAKGTQSKEVITNKILEVFEGSFIDEKNIRIPIDENGEVVEIKVTLTTAKDVKGGAVLPKTEATPVSSAPSDYRFTDEEKQKIQDALTALGM